ncbi:response regulator transcription factor [Streptomyces sp. NPDC004629]|uniref:response regulator transcription factor n=1 Tax=Streptomyces sp. NPDC004629 TaxID=3364705 RepID=UPI00367F2041
MRTPAAVPDPRPFRVLLVEDDDTTGRRLESGLRGNGYAPTWSRTGADALAEAERAPYDALLLDLGLPDMDGLDVARRVRDRLPHLRIVVFTSREDGADVVAGREAGADDHLTKPFGLDALLSRLRVHLRPRYSAAPLSDPVRLGDLMIEVAARRCTLGDAEVPLPPEEFAVLVVLARHRDTAVTGQLLAARAREEDPSGTAAALDVTVASLRRRLADATRTAPHPVRLPRISTLRGHAYRLETDLP